MDRNATGVQDQSDANLAESPLCTLVSCPYDGGETAFELHVEAATLGLGCTIEPREQLLTAHPGSRSIESFVGVKARH